MLDDLIQSVIQLQKLLGQAGVSSAVVGGLAVAVWGEPRLTRDVDVKVSLQRNQATRLLSLLKPDYTFLSDNPDWIYCWPIPPLMFRPFSVPAW